MAAMTERAFLPAWPARRRPPLACCVLLLCGALLRPPRSTAQQEVEVASAAVETGATVEALLGLGLLLAGLWVREDDPEL